MIFVTVGMSDYSFVRLIREMDRIAASINERAIMQIGNTSYNPQNTEFFRFGSPQKIEQYIRDSKLVVSHCGVGTIVLLLKLGKPLILVPRMKKYGESIDDHQIEIAKELENRGIAVSYEIDDLEVLLQTSDIRSVYISMDKDKVLTLALKEYLDRLKTSKGVP